MPFSLVGTKLLDWAPLQVGFYFTCSGPICYALALFACVDRDRFPHCSVPKFYEAQMKYIFGKHAPSIRPTYVADFEF